MFDAKLRPLIDPPLNAAGRWVAACGIGANALTVTGLAIGLAGAGAIAFQQFGAGLALIALNRLLDGLDGAVARATGPSDLGGYLDIVADFAFYVAVPVGFGIVDPANALAALALVASFVLTGTRIPVPPTITVRKVVACREVGSSNGGGMILLPCRGSISHAEAEWSVPAQVQAGAAVLARVLGELLACGGPRSPTTTDLTP